MRFELIDHQARRLVGIPNVVLVLLGEVLVICVGDDCGNTVEVYCLLEIVLVPRYPVLCGEYLLVRGSVGVPDDQVEECWLVGAATVQCVVFFDPSHFFLVYDELKAAVLPAVSAGFEAHRERFDCSDEFINWLVLGRSYDSWKRSRIEAGFDHCVDGGGGRFCHGERVVSLRHNLKYLITTDSQWA